MKLCQKAIFIRVHDHRLWFYYRKQKQQSTTFLQQKSTDLSWIQTTTSSRFYVRYDHVFNSRGR